MQIFVPDANATEWYTPEDLEKDVPQGEPIPEFEIRLSATDRDRSKVADLWGQMADGGFSRVAYQAVDALLAIGVKGWRNVERDFSREALLSLQYPLKAALATRFALNALGFSDASEETDTATGN